MRHLILTVFFVIISGPLHAQRNAIDYYGITNEAELAICRKDLPAAAALYSKAFAINPDKPFTTDLLNAYYCAMDLEDYPTARQHIGTILRRGVSSKSIGMLWVNHSVAQWDSIQHWLQIFKNDTLSVHASIQKIRALDSTNWSEKFWAGVRYPRGPFPEKLRRRLQIMDQRHAKKLARLLREHGVPNEADGVTNHLIDGPPVFQRLAKVVVSESRSFGYGLDTLLFEAVLRYEYAPQDFLRLLDAIEQSHNAVPLRYGGYQFSQRFTETLIMVRSDSSLYPIWAGVGDKTHLIDSQRRAIGLETHAELYAKLHFKNTERAALTRYGKYLFGITGNVWLTYDSRNDASEEIRKFELYMTKQH